MEGCLLGSCEVLKQGVQGCLVWFGMLWHLASKDTSVQSTKTLEIQDLEAGVWVGNLRFGFGRRSQDSAVEVEWAIGLL